MFDFNEDKLKDGQIMKVAMQDGRDAYKWCNAWRAVERRKAQSKLQFSSDLINGYNADEVRKAIEFYRKAKSP